MLLCIYDFACEEEIIFSYNIKEASEVHRD